MPTSLPKTCALGVICEREDPRDVVVLRTGSPYQSMGQLPARSTVGTSSVRRRAQIAHFYPHLKCAGIRGNLNTRLRKLDADDSPYECLVLAAAGLKRIDLGSRISQYLNAKDGILYAPGQGALGLEIREGDNKILELLSGLSHEPTTLACTAEKSLLRTLEGGCSAPIGVETAWEGKLLGLRGQVISADGKEIVESSMQEQVTTVEEAERLGDELAKTLLKVGADKILASVRAEALQAGGTAGVGK
jgi:hydroxymethylbilane synthase